MGMIVTNPAHREYIEENLAWGVVEHLGLECCGTCAVADVLTIVDSETPRLQMHRYASSTTCREVPVCPTCIQQGALEPSPCEYEPEEQHGYHQSCIRYCNDPGCTARVLKGQVVRFQESMMLEQQRLRPDLWEGVESLGPKVFDDWVRNQNIGAEEWLEAESGDVASITRIRTIMGLPPIV